MPSTHSTHSSTSKGLPKDPRTYDPDFSISCTAKDLCAEGRAREALAVLEERIDDSWSADKVNNYTLFQAAKIHSELSVSRDDAHHQRSRAYLKRLVVDHRENAFAWQLLGDIYERQGHLERAGRCYIMAARHDKNPLPAYGKLVGILQALGRTHLTRRLLEKMVVIDGNDHIAWGLTAQFELASKNIEAAREAVSKHIGLTPRDPVAWAIKAKIELAGGDTRSAHVAVSMLVNLSPDSPMSWGLKAKTDLAAGDTKAARNAVNRLLEIDPTSVMGWGQKTHVELVSRDVEAAQYAANRLVELAPDDPASWGHKIHVDLALGDYDAARASAARRKELTPRDVKAWGLTCLVELSAGDPAAAKAAALRHIELEPQNVVGWGLLGKVALVERDDTTMEQVIDALSKLDPTNMRIYLYKGRMALLNNDDETAKQCGEQLMKQFHASHIYYLRHLVELGHFDSTRYEELVADFKRQGKIGATDNRFNVGRKFSFDALGPSDEELAGEWM